MYMNYNIFNENIFITLIIILCIMFVSAIYIALGLTMNYGIDEYIYTYDHKFFSEEYVKKTPLYLLYLNITLTFSILMITAFFVKSIFDVLVASNIDISKYKYIYEMYTGSVLIIILSTFSQTLNKQYKDIKLKLSGYIY
jgi:magnesium-transporting ATPase (P-type)